MTTQPLLPTKQRRNLVQGTGNFVQVHGRDGCAIGRFSSSGVDTLREGKWVRKTGRPTSGDWVEFVTRMGDMGTKVPAWYRPRFLGKVHNTKACGM